MNQKNRKLVLACLLGSVIVFPVFLTIRFKRWGLFGFGNRSLQSIIIEGIILSIVFFLVLFFILKRLLKRGETGVVNK